MLSVLPFLARCYLKAISPEISHVFPIRFVFLGFSLFFPFESYSFQEFLKFSGLKSCFSRTTGNGLETDELGLAGSLACRGLCCLCCAPIPWLGVM